MRDAGGFASRRKLYLRMLQIFIFLYPSFHCYNGISAWKPLSYY